MADYSKARAKRKSSETIKLDDNISKSEKRKIANKVKKSPVLIVCLLFLIIGALGGYFAFNSLSAFEMLSYSVNGTVSAESDYVIVDLMGQREKLEADGSEVTMEELYASIDLEDGGVTCKFLGVDVSSTVTTKYYYREDISHDAVTVDAIDVTIAGVYYIEYTSSHFAFSKTTLIRTIIVMGVENDG